VFRVVSKEIKAIVLPRTSCIVVPSKEKETNGKAIVPCFLATDTEVPGSIPGASRISEK
jgi:hypothetical protein